MNSLHVTHYTIDGLVFEQEEYGAALGWLNVLNIRKMEKRLRKAKGIPFYYGFAAFDLDRDTVIFKPWPFYYYYSYKFRKRQLRHRLGHWLRRVLIPRLMR